MFPPTCFWQLSFPVPFETEQILWLALLVQLLVDYVGYITIFVGDNTITTLHSHPAWLDIGTQNISTNHDKRRSCCCHWREVERSEIALATRSQWKTLPTRAPAVQAMLMSCREARRKLDDHSSLPEQCSKPCWLMIIGSCGVALSNTVAIITIHHEKSY